MASIESVMRNINRTYGENTIVFGKDAKHMRVRRVRTGIFSLDYEIGGGLPLGRLIMIHGPFSAGKTTMALKIARRVQKKKTKNSVVYIDVEGSLDIDWAAKLGVDTDSLILPPNIPSGEAALNIAEEMVKTGDVGLIVIDSVAAITPQAEVDSSFEENNAMALQPRLINKFIRKITQALIQKAEDGTMNECIVLLLNQERDTMDKYKPVITPGGRGKDFASSITIQIRKGDWIAEGTGDAKVNIGHEIAFKVLKNKTFPRSRDGVFDFYFANSSEGIRAGQVDNLKSIILKASEVGVIKRNGSIYTYNKIKYKGQERLILALSKKKELLDKLRTDLYADLKKSPSETVHSKGVTVKKDVGDN